MMIVSAWLAVQPNNTNNSDDNSSTSTSTSMAHMIKSNTRKRPYHNRELDDLENKLHLQSSELPVDSSTFGLGWDGTSILVAVNNLFKLIAQASRSGVVNPVTHLIVGILHELVAAPHTHTLLVLLPPTLLPNIVPLLSKPYSFSYSQLLALTAPRPVGANSELPGDVLTAQTPTQAAASRRSAAKLLCVYRNLQLNSDNNSS